MNNVIFTQLEPAELQDRFRRETLARDKTQVTAAVALILIATIGFIILDLFFWPDDGTRYISIVTRCVVVIVSFATVWIVRRLSNIKHFDQIVFVWVTIIVCHMLVINAIYPSNYISVIVWDILTICGIYILLPVPLHLQILSALLLAGGSGMLWWIYRLTLAETYETVAVLAAYFFTNAWGIFVSWQLDRSYRQQFVLLIQETKAREELEAALDEVTTLRGIIPICSYCKKIRNDKGYYEVVEKYIMEHSEAVFSHTYCPECVTKHYPDLQKTSE